MRFNGDHTNVRSGLLVERLLVTLAHERLLLWREGSKAGANGASEKMAADGNHLRRSMSVGLQRLNVRILL